MAFSIDALPSHLANLTVATLPPGHNGPARTVIDHEHGVVSLWSALLRVDPVAAQTPDVGAYYSFLHGSEPCAPPCTLADLAEDWARGVAVLLLSSGGYFAGAVYRGGRVVVHKRVARYTSRKKQGGAETKHRRRRGGRTGRSAGGQMRAANAKKLDEDVASLMVQWRGELSQCSRVFLVAGDTRPFFGPGSPLAADDVRLRRVPITTHRPSQAEVERIVRTLATVRIGDNVKEEEEEEEDVAAVDAERDDEEEEEEDEEEEEAL